MDYGICMDNKIKNESFDVQFFYSNEFEVFECILTFWV